jgi:hypothetical protein
LTALFWDHGGPQTFSDITEFTKLAPQEFSEFYQTKMEIAKHTGDFSKMLDAFKPGPSPAPAIDSLQSAREDFMRLQESFAGFTQALDSAKMALNTAFGQLEAHHNDIRDGLCALRYRLFPEGEINEEEKENTDTASEVVATVTGPTDTLVSNNVLSTDPVSRSSHSASDIAATRNNKRDGSPLGSPTNKRLHEEEKEELQSKIGHLLSDSFGDIKASQRISAAQLAGGEAFERTAMMQIIEDEAVEYLEKYGHIPSSLRQLATQANQEHRDVTLDEVQSLGDVLLGPTRRLQTPEELLHAAEEIEAEILVHRTNLWTIQPPVDRDKISLDHSAYAELEQVIIQAKAALNLHEYDKALLIISGPKMRFIMERSEDEDVAHIATLLLRENRTHEHTMNLITLFSAALERVQQQFVAAESGSDTALRIPVDDNKFKLLLVEHDLKIAKVERKKIDDWRDVLTKARGDRGSGLRSRRRETIEIIYKSIGLPVLPTVSGTLAEMEDVGSVLERLYYENVDQQRELEKALKTLHEKGVPTQPGSSRKEN